MYGRANHGDATPLASRLSPRSLVVLAFAWLLSSGGCVAHDHVCVGTEIAPREVAPAKPLPAACRDLEVLVVDPAPTMPREEADRFAGYLQTALERTGAFGSVTRGGPAVVRTALRLEVTPVTLTASEVDTSPGGATFAWLFLGFYANWVHDRTVRVEGRCRLVLKDQASGGVLARFPPTKVTLDEEVSTWERRSGAGGFIATIFYWPPMALETEPRLLLDALGPDALAGAARSVVDAAARLRIRQVESVAIWPYPVEGLRVTVTSPKAGPPRPNDRVALRIEGEDLPLVRQVWIGDAVAYRADPAKPLAKGAPLEVSAPATLTATSRIVARVLREGGRSSSVAEVGLVTRTLIEAPR